MKACTKCGKTKPLNAFHKVRRGRNNRRSVCRKCIAVGRRARYQSDPEYAQRVRDRVRQWQEENPERFAESRRRINAKRVHNPAEHRSRRLKRNYGMTPEQYADLVSEQSGRCAICRTAPTRLLVVDHNHKTGEVRGLLCDSCNQGLGRFRESSELLRLAAEYLDGHRVYVVTHNKTDAAATVIDDPSCPGGAAR